MEIPMDAALIARIKNEMEREAQRSAPPDGFPSMSLIRTERYTDADFFELERAQLWTRTWLLAAHREELPERGSYRLWDKAGPGIIIVRGHDDEIRAFYNACQHRGAPLVRDDSGKTRRFVCKYHAWTYELDGELVGVPDEHDFVALDKGCHGLKPVRCETWGGWIFVNQDPDAGPLLEFLGPIPAEMEQYGTDSLRFAGRHSMLLNCNWKAAMDAFLEVYHLKFIHPNSVDKLLDHRRTTIGLFENGHSRMVSAKRPESTEMGFGGSGVEPIATATEIPRIANLSYNIFPNLVTPTDLSGFPYLQFWPRDAGTTEFEISWYVADWGDGELPEFWKAFIGIFDVVLGEDTENLSWIQSSMESPGFAGIPLSYQERRIYYFHEHLDAVLGRDRVPEALRVDPLMHAYVERRA
jgi:phenylpropionate dioxygenase-like ring-hydroxylating dioxygenase large terminal subunit